MMVQRKIFTVGYGGRTSDEFIVLLKRYGIETLVDVRSQPYSKFNPDFTRSLLTKTLARTGQDYIFMGDSLGGRPDDESCFVAGKLDAARCEERDWYQRGIRDLKALARERRVAIMCSEKDPANCHRSYVVGKILAKDADIAVAHIDKAGELKSQAELETQIKPRQLDKLF